MLDYPWAVQGRGEANTIVMEELDVIAKIGAEGVLVMATPPGGLGGRQDARRQPAGHLAGRTDACWLPAGAVDIPGVSSVLEKVVEPVLGGGRPVGKIRLGHAVSALLD